MANRIQLSTDGFRGYESAVGPAFRQDVDWAQIQKISRTNPQGGETKYSPAICTGTKVRVLKGDPDPAGSQPATSSGRTSRCEWGCGASRG